MYQKSIENQFTYHRKLVELFRDRFDFCQDAQLGIAAERKFESMSLSTEDLVITI